MVSIITIIWSLYKSKRIWRAYGVSAGAGGISSSSCLDEGAAVKEVKCWSTHPGAGGGFTPVAENNINYSLKYTLLSTKLKQWKVFGLI